MYWPADNLAWVGLCKPFSIQLKDNLHATVLN